MMIMKINKTTKQTYESLYELWKQYNAKMMRDFPNDDYPFRYDMPGVDYFERADCKGEYRYELDEIAYAFAEHIGFDLREYEKQLKKSTTLHDKFKDQNKRNEQRIKIRNTWKERKDNGETITGIEVSQKDNYGAYMREYQKKYRESHPNYYRDFQRKKRERLKKQEIEAEDFFDAILNMGENDEK